MNDRAWVVGGSGVESMLRVRISVFGLMETLRAEGGFVLAEGLAKRMRLSGSVILRFTCFAVSLWSSQRLSRKILS